MMSSTSYSAALRGRVEFFVARDLKCGRVGAADDEAGAGNMPHPPVIGCSSDCAKPVASTEGCSMPDKTSELDSLQSAYKAAVEEWVTAIRQEEVLASVNHSVAEVDKWEAAHFKEDEVRDKVLDLKKKYEDALREEFFGI
jgi:hypothetical protein